jgi:PAS domain S-box-containing protein
MASFRDALTALMDAYFVVDAQRRISDHNRTFLDLSGSRQAANRGNTPVHCYERLKLDICKKDCIALRALKAGRATQINEIRGKASDGRDLVVAGRAVPLIGENGTVESVLVTYRDVTEETALREQLHHLERETRHEREVLLKNLAEKTQEAQELQRQLGSKKPRQ